MDEYEFYGPVGKAVLQQTNGKDASPPYQHEKLTIEDLYVLLDYYTFLSGQGGFSDWKEIKNKVKYYEERLNELYARQQAQLSDNAFLLRSDYRVRVGNANRFFPEKKYDRRLV